MNILHRETRLNKTHCQVCEIKVSTPTSVPVLCEQCKTWLAIEAQVEDLRNALRKVL